MKATHSKKTLLTEINMVPFIDVVLVLLIIFMVMSPFLTKSQIAINLPQAVSSNPADDQEPIKIQLNLAGQIYVQNQSIAQGSLESRLRTALMANAAKSVMIEADKGVPFERVVKVLDAAHQANAQKVGVAVIPPAQ